MAEDNNIQPEDKVVDGKTLRIRILTDSHKLKALGLDTLDLDLDPMPAEVWQRIEEAVRRTSMGDGEAMGQLAATLRPTAPGAAMVLYSGAAKRGDVKSMVDLGIMLNERGRVDEASRWWTRAAVAGNPGAIFALGTLAAKKHPRKARKFYKKAAELGHAQAMDKLAILLWRAHRRRAARHWFEQAVRSGRPIAMHNYGMFLRRRDRQRAIDFWRQAGDKGYVLSMEALARELEDESPDEAKHWSRRVAENSSSQ